MTPESAGRPLISVILVPCALRLEMTDANKNIGPFNIVPGSARIVQMDKRIRRYSKRPSVFQLAFFARGTCGYP